VKYSAKRMALKAAGTVKVRKVHEDEDDSGEEDEVELLRVWEARTNRQPGHESRGGNKDSSSSNKLERARGNNSSLRCTFPYTNENRFLTHHRRHHDECDQTPRRNCLTRC
jgi:hypothetical protein